VGQRTIYKYEQAYLYQGMCGMVWRTLKRQAGRETKFAFYYVVVIETFLYVTETSVKINKNVIKFEPWKLHF
jgi:hypothetical protein